MAKDSPAEGAIQRPDPSRPEAERADRVDRVDRDRTGRAPAEGSSPAAIASGEAGVVLDDAAVRRALTRISHEILERNQGDASRLYLVGIPNGGVPLAREIARQIRAIAGSSPVVGILDTTLYRDDLASSGERPRLRRTEMPSVVDDRVVVLVDDVASTGRTIRAAMDALIDFGRPRVVQVVALVDRGHRELPIKIDYVGKNIPTRRDDRVELRTAEGAEEGPFEVRLIREEGRGEG